MRIVFSLFVSLCAVSCQIDTSHLLSGPIPPSFVGITINHWNNFNYTVNNTIPYSTVRSLDASGLGWWAMHESANYIVWNYFDPWVAINKGKDMIYTFYDTPTWASSQPTVECEPGVTYSYGACYPPKNLSSWDYFVESVVTRSAGSIEYWELWNEPDDDGQGWRGNMSSLVEMGQRAYNIIKRVNPKATVLCPGITSGGTVFYQRYLSEGGVCDVMAFHGYTHDTTYHAGEAIISTIANYHAMREQNNYTRLPLWCTEAGGFYTSNTPATFYLGSSFMMKMFTLMWSLGVERYVYYSYDNLLNSTTKAPLPTLSTFSQVSNWLVGATMVSACNNATGTFVCGLTRPNYYVGLIVWNPNENLTMSVNSTFHQWVDMFGVVTSIVNSSIHLSFDQPILIQGNSSISSTSAKSTSSSSPLSTTAKSLTSASAITSSKIPSSTSSSSTSSSSTPSSSTAKSLTPSSASTTSKSFTTAVASTTGKSLTSQKVNVGNAIISSSSRLLGGHVTISIVLVLVSLCT